MITFAILLQIDGIYKMDIVSRLKTFIDHLNIPVTQFADTCKIPRPTLTQLLNGRNKKVSDEIIRKLHAEYPALNVSWLLFGEGDMLANSNIQFSEPQNQSLIDFSEPQSPENQDNNQSIDFGSGFDDSEPEKSNEAVHDLEVALTPASMAFDRDKTKKIVNIIVYYNDNSFESFIPGTPKK